MSQPCGTPAGYQTHRRNDETPCDACADANYQYHRNYYLTRRGRSPEPTEPLQPDSTYTFPKARTRLPFEPLEQMVRVRGLSSSITDDLAARRLWMAYYQARHRGSLILATADRLAVGLLGIHPCNIWPEWFAEEESA